MRSKEEWANTFLEIAEQKCEECIAKKSCENESRERTCLESFAYYCLWGKDEENVNDSEVEK